MSGRIWIEYFRTQVFRREFGHFAAQIGALLLLLLALLLSSCGQEAANPSPTNTTGPVPASPTTAPTSTTTTPDPTNPAQGTPTGSKAPIPNPPPLKPLTPQVLLPNPTPDPNGSEVPLALRTAYQTALADIIKRNNRAVAANIKLMSYSSEDFSDSSLGCPQPNMMYTQVITPGYILTLDAGGTTYIYHTNLAGNRVVLCTNGPLTNPKP